jgi:DNA topoisomerase-2
MASNDDLSKKYQKKSDKEHVLDNPDTYIGSIEKISSNVHIYDEATHKIVEKQITYIPGLYKLFDEGIVNCRDHVVRMKSRVDAKAENALPVTHIDISIEEDGTITMINDGNGIDIAQKDGIWIPELVFGHLRTSTNYNKDDKEADRVAKAMGTSKEAILGNYVKILDA